MVRTLSVLGLLVSLVSLVSLRAAPAMAQDDALDDIPIASQRPTSGEASLLSGRTLGVGEVMVAAAAGWPWIWAQVELALTSSFNLGIRPALIYGSPFMALEPGVGGELAVPMRIHLYGEGDLDLAAFITPAFAIGEAAATAGEGGTVLAGDLGIGSRLELGARLGFRAMEGLTLLVGAGGHVGFVYAEAADRFVLVHPGHDATRVYEYDVSTESWQTRAFDGPALRSEPAFGYYDPRFGVVVMQPRRGSRVWVYRP